MSIHPDMSITEVAFEVGGVLAAANVVAVLSGGGAATLYAPEAHQTRDLDFIVQSYRAKVEPILALGFRPRGRSGIFEHADIPFTLEFPAGPLAVGDELIVSWNTVESEGRTLNVLTATDCVRDRLAAAIHWKDERSVDQAIAVARRHEIDLDVIREWCEREGGARTFERFVDRLD